jgi:DNA (cytosine-5)-methyltransferase 1
MAVTDTPRVLDMFAGCGGSAQGLEAAGLTVAHAANHDPNAVAISEANFPHTEHFLADLLDADATNYRHPAHLPAADILWASPSCTQHSPAASKRAYLRNRTLLDAGDDSDDDTFAAATESERSRFTAVCVLQYARAHHPKVIFVENVIEFALWGYAVPGTRRGDGTMYQWWRRELHLLGYQTQEVFLNSAILGAPSWRDRMYIVAWRRDLPTPDLTHTAAATCPRCGPVDAHQVFNRPTTAWPLPRWGRLGRQYHYRCPRCTAVVTPPVRGAVEVIDWAELGVRIGDRSAAGLRPLAVSTVARIRLGLELCHRQPAVIVTGGVGRLARPGELPPPLDPTPATEATRTGAAPGTSRTQTLWGVQVKQNGRPGDTACHGLDRPLGTITAYQDTTAIITTPATVLTTGTGTGAGAQGRAIGLVDCHTSRVRSAAQPLPAILTHDQQAQLVVPLGGTPSVDDAHYRMLSPQELKLGMSFDASFDLLDHTLPQRARIRAVGNAVTPVVSQWLAERVLRAVFS